MAGAALVLRDEELSIGLFLRQLCQRRITVLNLPTGYWHELVAELGRSGEPLPAGLRLAIVGGEAMRADRVRAWTKIAARRAPSARLVNSYGPTEATVVATRWTAPEEIADGNGAATVPIGRRIYNVRVYVLDDAMRVCPVGAVGELYIGGLGVARGYLNRPGLTAASFVPDPFGPSSGDRGGRLYKTGDRVRYRPDGELEFLGRIDDQVKIRGFRIELGEIEAALRDHPGVTETIVVARDAPSGARELAAYITADPGETADASERDGWCHAHVEASQVIYEEAYSRISAGIDPELNTVAWNSSYTNRPIPADEMSEWALGTVERIEAMCPDRVLEIGCGTGMLLLRLAPRCSRYMGTDFSRAVLGWLSDHVGHLPQVELSCCDAADLSVGGRGRFDTVIINSVTQHFPSADYLLRVLEGAIDSTEIGGSIFVGDVRSLPLLEAFATSVKFFQADDELSLRALRDQIDRRVLGEQELVIDPRFFSALKLRQPRIREVHVWLKPGRADNEMTRFRYDVVMRLDEKPPAQSASVVDWSDEIRSLASLGERLTTEAPDVLHVRGIPNRRVGTDMAILDALSANESSRTVGDLRRQLGRLVRDGVDPEELRSLGRRYGYHARTTWIRADPRGAYEVVLVPGQNGQARIPPCALSERASVPLRSLTNDPLRARTAGALVPRLKRHLRSVLPEYMVPPSIVVLGDLPRSASGKVAVEALPAPDGTRPDLGAEFVASSSTIEKTLVEIWGEVLGLEAIGIHDNFFDLGGHSLAATRVASRLRDRLGRDVPLSDLFDRPTVADLARHVEMLQGSPDTARRTPPLERADRAVPLPLSFAQQRLWFLDQVDPGSPAYNVPDAVHMSGHLEVAALKRALAAMVARHEILRTTFPAADGEPYQHIASGGATELRVVDLSKLPEHERASAARRALETTATARFDLSGGPLWRATLVRYSATRHTLLLTLHHILTDGWSQAVFFSQLADLYEAFVENRQPPRVELPVQYADFAAWQRRMLTGKALAPLVDYWTDQLAGLPALELPTNRLPDEAHGSAALRHRFRLPVASARRLADLGRRHDCTLSMTLTAAFMALLQRFTGQNDFAIGTPVSNRNRRELDDLVGNFVNLLVLRADLEGDPTFDDLLARVRRTTLAALEHQELPFERLVEQLHPRRDGWRNPLFRVSFALQDRPPPARELSQLSMRLEPFEACSCTTEDSSMRPRWPAWPVTSST